MQRIPLALPPALAAPMAAADPYDHMGDWGYGHGLGIMFGPVLWLVVLGLVVVGVVWLVRRLEGTPPRHGPSAALAELDLRLARGEIEIEDHAARKKALGG